MMISYLGSGRAIRRGLRGLVASAYVTMLVALAACPSCSRPRQDASMAVPDQKTNNAASPNAALLDEIDSSGKWFHAKKTRPIWVKTVERDQTVQTLEGEVHVTAGNRLCRGFGGEIWPQKPAEVDKKYTPTEEVDADGWRKHVPRPDAEGVMAAQVNHPFAVVAPWGRLSGKAGDFVVKNFRDRDVAYPDDVWIVDQSLFRQTYEAVPASP